MWEERAAIFQFDSGLFRLGGDLTGVVDDLERIEAEWRRQAENMATIDVLGAWF